MLRKPTDTKRKQLLQRTVRVRGRLVETDEDELELAGYRRDFPRIRGRPATRRRSARPCSDSRLSPDVTGSTIPFTGCSTTRLGPGMMHSSSGIRGALVHSRISSLNMVGLSALGTGEGQNVGCGTVAVDPRRT